MPEEAPNFDQPTGEPSAEQQAWGAVEELNQQFPDAKNSDLAGSSSEFKKETKEYQELGKKVFSALSDSAKEAAGVRDEKDLGEMLQEKNSWNRQIAERSHSILGDVRATDQYLSDNGWNNGRDPITGEPTEDSPFGRIDNPDVENYTRAAFLNIASDEVYNLGGLGVDTLIYLIAHKNPPEADPNARTLDALNNSAITRILTKLNSDKKELSEIQNTLTYETIARRIHDWHEDQAGRYVATGGDGSLGDARTSRLYKRIDEIMSASNPEPLPDNIFSDSEPKPEFASEAEPAPLPYDIF